ncbi:Rieske 2Fe-2S domain-containing protein [Hydrogenophaga sp. 2FB]|uniref:Rieske (2Fe-2S) protein n=1 Tax=Hydrogenophaga sp. 2FB TaxID=2502187 RepID=UPI0010F58B56|nr:Rieske 2Fe-2S domain-containing protein [Hydrogenophaga sp. 2FB]
MPEPSLIAAGALQDLPPGSRKLVFRPGQESIVVLNVNGQFFALENSCPHAGASIASGACQGHVLSCPAHGLKFNIQNGQCTASPDLRIPIYDVVVQDESLWLRANEPAGDPSTR